MKLEPDSERASERERESGRITATWDLTSSEAGPANRAAAAASKEEDFYEGISERNTGIEEDGKRRKKVRLISGRHRWAANDWVKKMAQF